MSLSARSLSRHVCRSCRITLAKQSAAHASTSSSTPTPPASQSSSSISQSTLQNGASQHSPDNAQGLPRWARTPEAMKAPHRIRPKTDRDELVMNSDPAVLDNFYVRMLGPGGDQVLPEDIKWLAVTNKTFDQGRRGFNERLAFFGRKIVEMQSSLALLDANREAWWYKSKGKVDSFGRQPFVHPQTVVAAKVTTEARDAITETRRLAQLAESYGARNVIRWNPRLTHDLQASGIDKVLRDTLFAVIGAVSLQKGGDVANQVVRTRILRPLGVV